MPDAGCRMPDIIRLNFIPDPMPHYISKLIDKREHQQLDFKFEITDARRIARSLVAFANTDGGRLLIGVKDNGASAGMRSDEEYYMVEAAAKMYCKPPVTFLTKEWTVNTKNVLEIIVPKSPYKPHFAAHKDGKWMVYIRNGDQNLLANRILRSEEHTSELQSPCNLVCRLLLEKKHKYNLLFTLSGPPAGTLAPHLRNI